MSNQTIPTTDIKVGDIIAVYDPIFREVTAVEPDGVNILTLTFAKGSAPIRHVSLHRRTDQLRVRKLGQVVTRQA